MGLSTNWNIVDWMRKRVNTLDWTWSSHHLIIRKHDVIPNVPEDTRDWITWDKIRSGMKDKPRQLGSAPQERRGATAGGIRTTVKITLKTMRGSHKSRIEWFMISSEGRNTESERSQRKPPVMSHQRRMFSHEKRGGVWGRVCVLTCSQTPMNVVSHSYWNLRGENKTLDATKWAHQLVAKCEVKPSR